MGKVKVKIDGREYAVEAGQTVLEVCRSLGIDIPTLCYFAHLTPIGACRVCLVEVNGAVKTSCTTQVAEGMEVITASEKLNELRKEAVELLFVERNHYCMYCEMTGGDCELQALGYRFGIDHFPYPTYERKLPVDGSHPFILFDHNRCVLCRRCVQACNELAGHEVLFEGERGIETKIIADSDLPLGESSCVSCGVCVQVCPTGALVDKQAAYLGKEREAEVVKSACFGCALGCGVEIYKKKDANHIIKIYGDWESEVSHGLTCREGRYLLLDRRRERLAQPLRRERRGWEEISVAEAIEDLAGRAAQATVLVDGSLFNEELEALLAAFPGRVHALREATGPLSTVKPADLGGAKVLLVYNLDLDERYGVLGSFLKLASRDRGAEIVLVGERAGLGGRPRRKVSEADVPALARELSGRKAVVIHAGLPEEAADALKRAGCGFLYLPPAMNTLGLVHYGIKSGSPRGDSAIVVGQDLAGLEELRERVSWLAVLTPYDQPSLEQADLVVPIGDGFERGGSFYSVDGELAVSQAVLRLPENALDLKQVFGAKKGVGA